MTNCKQISNNAYRKVAPLAPDTYPRLFSRVAKLFSSHSSSYQSQIIFAHDA